jgi:hypothetical protein
MPVLYPRARQFSNRNVNFSLFFLNLSAFFFFSQVTKLYLIIETCRQPCSLPCSYTNPWIPFSQQAAGILVKAVPLQKKLTLGYDRFLAGEINTPQNQLCAACNSDIKKKDSSTNELVTTKCNFIVG